MSKLSLCEIQQSQLDKTPVVEGQLIICKDTGNMYRDFGKTRVQTGRDIEIVAELPLAPINGKIYALRSGEVWLYEGGDWTALNQQITEISNTEIDEILNS
jgi:hypothetical protein